MSNQDFLSELLGIAKLRVTGTEFTGREQIKLVVESIEEAGICPDCRQISIQVHDQSEEQLIRDLAYGERRCYLSYRARRFRCETCNKTFVERLKLGDTLFCPVGRTEIEAEVFFLAWRLRGMKNHSFLNEMRRMVIINGCAFLWLFQPMFFKFDGLLSEPGFDGVPGNWL